MTNIKYILIFLTISLSLSGCLINPHDKDDFSNFYNEGIDLTGNLVFYHFNEPSYQNNIDDIRDAAGNENHSDSIGALTKSAGIYGQGIYCNGVDSGVDITPAIFDNSFSQRTISVWFLAEATNGIRYIYEEGGNINGIVIYIEDGVLYGGTYKDATADYANFIPFSVEPFTWYNVAITFHTDDGFNLFMNGQHVGGPLALGANMPSHTNDNGICFQNDDSVRHTGQDTRPGGQYNHFLGVIDELAVWNRTLDGAEILNLFHRQGRL